jgi:hypothetical protein
VLLSPAGRLERAGSGWSAPANDAVALAARRQYEVAHTDDFAAASLVEVYEAVVAGDLGDLAVR